MANQPREPEVQEAEFGPWKVTTIKSHILKSDGPERKKFEAELELPQIPEMIFANNTLRLSHQSGFVLHFNALDALRRVDAHNDHLKVAASKTWQEARAECEHIKKVIKPYDWTFTTDYKGTLDIQPGCEMKVSETTERIDIEKLKRRENIGFYSDVVLFEDELSDNGCSILSVKIISWNYLIREYTSKDEMTRNLKLPSHILTDPNEVSKYLKVKNEICEKLEFPESREQNTNYLQPETSR
ncbi:TIP41-like protein isoform X2 [Pomacea canaliculata]|uniref:TIP41-like protein isoform X2 n=1 Tax=Pomacea canaliculata TaxID=400727 RepID=UPI000D72B7DD|nr:TIP41-like protein isoform X2 [Pomacea canaliculata]